MAQIIFEINDNNLPRIERAMAGLFSIPTKRVPNPEKPIEGAPKKPVDEIESPKFTLKEWVKECVRQWMIKQVFRFETIQAQKAAVVNSDDSLIQ